MYHIKISYIYEYEEFILLKNFYYYPLIYFKIKEFSV
jgi:hypothetical protein